MNKRLSYIIVVYIFSFSLAFFKLIDELYLFNIMFYLLKLSLVGFLVMDKLIRKDILLWPYIGLKKEGL